MLFFYMDNFIGSVCVPSVERQYRWTAIQIVIWLACEYIWKKKKKIEFMHCLHRIFKATFIRINMWLYAECFFQLLLRTSYTSPVSICLLIQPEDPAVKLRGFMTNGKMKHKKIVRLTEKCRNLLQKMIVWIIFMQ